jgi:hypothetical protein
MARMCKIISVQDKVYEWGLRLVCRQSTSIHRTITKHTRSQLYIPTSQCIEQQDLLDILTVVVIRDVHKLIHYSILPRIFFRPKFRVSSICPRIDLSRCRLSSTVFHEPVFFFEREVSFYVAIVALGIFWIFQFAVPQVFATFLIDFL